MTKAHEEYTGQLKTIFRKTYGYDPAFTAQAPVCVNLIGDPTPSNRGLVLSAAVDRQIVAVARPKTGLKEKTCNVYSRDYSASDHFSLGTIEYSNEDSWKNYFRGLVSVWQKAGLPLVAFEAAFGSNIHQGAGLTSSAAYLVAFAKLLNEMTGARLSNLHIALLAQQAESEFFGVKCGLTDHLVSCLASPESALLLDLNTFAAAAIPLSLNSQGYTLLVTDCRAPLQLTENKYNERALQCEQALNILSSVSPANKVYSLRDVGDSALSAFDDNFPANLHNRCRHVLDENARVENAAPLLAQGDLIGFGSLMNESHSSLADLYEVASSDLNLLVSLSQQLEGVAGSRMTAGGFAGYAISLIKTDRIDAFKYHVIRPYEIATGLKTNVFCFNSAGGATASALSSAVGFTTPAQVFQPLQ